MFEDPGDPVPAEDSATTKQDPAKDMSERMRENVRYGIVSGILLSITSFLSGKTSSNDEVRAKLKSVVNAFVSGDDVSSGEKDWLIENFIERAKKLPCMSEDCYYGYSVGEYFTWYAAINAIFNDDNLRNRYFNESDKQLTQKEREMIGKYNRARSAFYAAENEWTEYMAGVNKLVMNQLLLKYGTIFQQVVPEWYKKVLRVAGVRSEPEQDS